MDEEDKLKIVVAGIAVTYSILSALGSKIEKKLEEEFLYVLIVRATILSFSIKYKWPISMCVTITMLITVFTVGAKEEQEKEVEEKQAKQKSEANLK